MGEPVASARVVIHPGKGPYTGPRPVVYSNSEGVYLFNRLKPGTYAVRAEKPSDGYPDPADGFYYPQAVPSRLPVVRVVEGDVTTGVVIKLGPRVATFKGRVVDEETGEPIPDAVVSFRHAEDPQQYYMGTGLTKPGSLDVAVPTKKRFVMAVAARGYSVCWVGGEGCQAEPHVFELSSPITKEFSIALTREAESHE